MSSDPRGHPRGRGEAAVRLEAASGAPAVAAGAVVVAVQVHKLVGGAVAVLETGKCHKLVMIFKENLLSKGILLVTNVGK